MLDRADTTGILNRQQGQYADTVNPKLMEGLQICLNAGATTGIGAGDGESDGNCLEFEQN